MWKNIQIWRTCTRSWLQSLQRANNLKRPDSCLSGNRCRRKRIVIVLYIIHAGLGRQCRVLQHLDRKLYLYWHIEKSELLSVAHWLLSANINFSFTSLLWSIRQIGILKLSRNSSSYFDTCRQIIASWKMARVTNFQLVNDLDLDLVLTLSFPHHHEYHFAIWFWVGIWSYWKLCKKPFQSLNIPGQLT